MGGGASGGPACPNLAWLRDGTSAQYAQEDRPLLRDSQLRYEPGQAILLFRYSKEPAFIVLWGLRCRRPPHQG